MSFLPPRYSFKIRKHNPIDRAAWWIIQRYLNTDRYAIRKVHMGPKAKYQVSTPAANSTGWRIYLEVKPTLLKLEEKIHRGEMAEFELNRHIRQVS